MWNQLAQLAYSCHRISSLVPVSSALKQTAQALGVTVLTSSVNGIISTAVGLTSVYFILFIFDFFLVPKNVLLCVSNGNV